MHTDMEKWLQMMSIMGIEGDGYRQFHDTWLAVINKWCDQLDPPRINLHDFY
jgi:hypothetical protein